ncbi:LSU ribosomal protein L24P [Coriobacterium glomerans PW2]|uniref:Large ribosomal subunit protein uL24 n=1 Tax=Coriobacterium glomerans (strain ATCC 49209 / DSM 20642 / JCM 10262 / PW2) TaxID=700015 RepID=F2N8N8_CORGP|nr:50S ribosomal protein L24 [Coriobacterium glomerans]AEB07421.1 LSU ribosomal protein L24P [Coriobacterium glomerans PW2]
MAMSIKKGDTVKILSGKDRGKQGTVLRAFPTEGKIKVEGIAIVKKAVRPNQQNQQGGIVPQEAKFDASNAMLVCPKCGKATRVGHEAGELEGKRTKLRVCKKCGNKF